MNEQPIVQVKISIDEESRKNHIKEAGRNRMINYFLFILLLCVAITHLLFFIGLHVRWWEFHYVGLLAAVAIALAFALSICRDFLKGTVPTADATYRDDGIFYVFYEDCLTMETKHYSGKFNYDYYIGASEHKTAFYLMHAAEHISLPKKHFSQQQQQLLRELFACKFGENFKGMK